MDITETANACHSTAFRKGFWADVNFCELFDDSELMLSKLALIHSEVSEGTEAVRHGDFENFGEEMADVIIRVFDLSVALRINIADEIRKKMAINEGREWKHGKRA